MSATFPGLGTLAPVSVDGAFSAQVPDLNHSPEYHDPEEHIFSHVPDKTSRVLLVPGWGTLCVAATTRVIRLPCEPILCATDATLSVGGPNRLTASLLMTRDGKTLITAAQGSAVSGGSEIPKSRDRLSDSGQLRFGLNHAARRFFPEQCPEPADISPELGSGNDLGRTWAWQIYRHDFLD